MDTSGILAIVLGVVGALVGALAVFVAWLWIARTQAAREAERAASTALALSSQLDGLGAELAAAVAERDKIRAEFAAFRDFLITAGILRPEANPAALGPADLVYTLQAPALDLLPTVEGLSSELLRAALVHAANRSGSRAARPFSRGYMCLPNGPLTRSQFERLFSALVHFGYLTDNPNTAAADLTPSGRRLLDLARAGEL